MKRKKIIAVIGQGKSVPSNILRQAEAVGKLIAEGGAMLICGGLGGVMEAACRGAKQAGGITIGVLPGRDTCDANDFVDIPIATGIGEARNSIIARTADVLIAVGGKYGTLSEIAFALNFNRAVIGLNTWQHIEGVIYADSAEEAVQLAFDFLPK